jgi:hypothetical protein
MLVLDMIEILPPLGKHKYDTWRIFPVKCYIDNFMHLRSCIRNVNKWLESAHDRALSTDGGPMWFSKMIDGWHNWRPGGIISGKLRILDGNPESGKDHKFRAPRW